MAPNPRVFLEISIGGEHNGQIVMELFDKEAPRTAEKFRALCTGERGIHLKGSSFSRVIPDFMCCGGERIGWEPNFPVERSASTRNFRDVGLLCTAHAVPEDEAPYDCDSGFFITTGPTPFLEGMNTIFGKVVGGMDVVKAIEQVGSRSGTIKKDNKVEISDCGEVPAPPPAPVRAPAPGSYDAILRAIR